MTEVQYKELVTDDELAAFDLNMYGRRVALKELEVEKQGLIHIPDGSVQLRSKEAYVMAVGPDVEWDVSVGDRVYYGQYAGAIFTRGGRKYLVMNDNDLIGKVITADNGG